MSMQCGHLLPLGRGITVLLLHDVQFRGSPSSGLWRLHCLDVCISLCLNSKGPDQHASQIELLAAKRLLHIGKGGCKHVAMIDGKL